MTGLNLEDFELLVSLNVFNEALMNDAVYKFKRYEDASLSYAGVDKHAGEAVGLFSTVLSRADYDMMAGQLASSMVADKQDPNDLPDFTAAVQMDDDDEEEEVVPVKPVYKTSEPRPSVVMETPTQYGSQAKPKPYTSYTPAQPKPKIAVDVKKMVIGVKVKHKAFGEGSVIKSDGRIITVEFADNVQKKFAFPGAFQDGFLTFKE